MATASYTLDELMAGITAKTRLNRPLIVLAGPTASGKTDLAQRIAEHTEAEIIGADSMQIYKGMDIGTGKIAAADRRVVHHGIDIVDPGEPYSASVFQDYARNIIERRDLHMGRSLLCGGTGFYIKGVIDDYQFAAGEQVGNEIRDHYMELARKEGGFAVWEELKRLDPASAQVVSPNDTKRVIRALEIFDQGSTYADLKEKLATIAGYYPVCYLALSVDPTILNIRINRRVDAMFEQGLVDEVERLINAGFSDAVTSNQAIGYKEVVAALNGECSLDDAREQIKTSSRRYAKRQRTWLRKDRRILWIDADDLDFEAMTNQALRYIERADELYKEQGTELKG